MRGPGSNSNSGEADEAQVPLSESALKPEGEGGCEMMMTEPEQTGEADHELEDECVSEDEERLHIATPLGQRPGSGLRKVEEGEDEPEPDEEDDEGQGGDFFEEDEPTIRQHLYSQHMRQHQQQQAYPRGAFDIGNLTVTKFPYGGQGQGGPYARSHQQHHQHQHGQSGGFLGGNLLKRDRDGIPVRKFILLPFSLLLM
jgi:hypothetical protein